MTTYAARDAAASRSPRQVRWSLLARRTEVSQVGEMRPRTVTIGQLRDHLSAHLKRVRGGAELVVMDRQTPVARLVQYTAVETDSAELAALVREGVLRAPRGRPPGRLPRGPKLRGNPLLEALLADREEER